MAKVRDSSLRKKVLSRDFGICRCCGFEADEVHHIIPLIYNGEDKPNNMISLCQICHTHAPDTKKEFYSYMKSGGAKTYMILGKLLIQCEEVERKSNRIIKFQEAFSLGKDMFLHLKKFLIQSKMEEYNPLDTNQVDDIDFSLEIAQNKDIMQEQSKPTHKEQ